MLKIKRNGHYADGQQPPVFGDAGHHRRCPCTRTATHGSRHEHHLRVVVEQSFQTVQTAFGLGTSHLGLGTSPQTFAQLNLHRHGRLCQRGAIGVAYCERYSLNALIIHVAHGITSAATDAHHLNDALHLVFHRHDEVHNILIHVFMIVFHSFLAHCLFSCKSTHFFLFQQ